MADIPKFIDSLLMAPATGDGEPPVRSLLFNPGCSLGWYAGCGDGTSVAKQDAMIDALDQYGANAIALNVMNEDCSSPFKGEYMASDLDPRKAALFLDFVIRLKNRNKLVAVTFYDGNEQSMRNTRAKYPFHRFMDRHAAFMSWVVQEFRYLADAFIIGIETNRYASMEQVEEAIALCKLLAIRTGPDGETVRVPVGTHEQNVSKLGAGRFSLRRRVPVNADFHGYETSNHPYHGHERSPEDMKAEIQFLRDNCAVPIWVMEANDRKDDHARRQNHAMASVPCVVGIDGVW
jgi:hypothetical protein